MKYLSNIENCPFCDAQLSTINGKKYCHDNSCDYSFSVDGKSIIVSFKFNLLKINVNKHSFEVFMNNHVVFSKPKKIFTKDHCLNLDDPKSYQKIFNEAKKYSILF